MPESESLRPEPKHLLASRATPEARTGRNRTDDMRPRAFIRFKNRNNTVLARIDPIGPRSGAHRASRRFPVNQSYLEGGGKP